MVDPNTEQTIDHLLHLLEAEPDFSAQLRMNFDRAFQAAGVPVSLDATRGFLKGSSAYSAEDPVESPEGYDMSATFSSLEFFCPCETI